MNAARGERQGVSRTTTNNVTIRAIVESDRNHWVRLREALWPGSLADHDEETRVFFEKRLKAPVVFVAEVRDRLVGFLEAHGRDPGR